MTRASVIVAILGVLCVSWLSLVALHLVALKRAGSAWSRDARLWVRLKIVELVLLVLFVVAASFGAPQWGLLVMALAFVLLVLVRHRIRRRAVDWPPRWVERS